jgi:hypothetical protein
MEETDNSNCKNSGRDILALVIVIFSITFLIAIVVVGIIVIKGLPEADKNGAFQSLYGTLLPLIGTWMGAVIAFYFGKENFEAASKSVQTMVEKFITSEDKLKSIKVSDLNVMIAIDNITDNKTIRTKADNEIKVEADLLGFFETNKNIERLPIMDDKSVIRYILHKSLITDFALNIKLDKIKIPMPATIPPAATAANKTLDLITLFDLINNSNEGYKLSVTKSVEFVTKDSSLLEVQTKINNSKYCQDVFVTADGSATKPIIGWITNNKVQEMGRV